MKETYDFLKDAEVFYLSTIDEEGNPRVRPFGAIAFIDRIYFVTSSEKKVYKQMVNYSKVEISATSKDGTSWIRLEGNVKFIDDDSIKDKLFENDVRLIQIYGEKREIMLPFILENAKSHIYSFVEKSKHYEF